EDLKEIPFDALSIEEKVDLSVAKKILGEDLRIVGNISPIDTLLRGTPKDVREESIKALKCGVDLLAPGCGVAPETPTRNLRAMADAAR
ncbi:MAG: methylcobamide--CoM methyltransferase, partial [Candidatus Methanolliviera hydrocarbonicum]